MKCPACGAEMHLMQVVLDDTMRHAPAVERQVFKCAACPQVARRLLFSVPLGSTNASSVAMTQSQDRRHQASGALASPGASQAAASDFGAAALWSIAVLSFRHVLCFHPGQLSAGAAVGSSRLASEQFRLEPMSCLSVSGRLSVRQADCAG
jgi:hypothetical protein